MYSKIVCRRAKAAPADPVAEGQGRAHAHLVVRRVRRARGVAARLAATQQHLMVRPSTTSSLT